MTPADPSPLLDRVLTELHRHGVSVDHRRHPPATTTADLALARDLPMSVGVKALVMKIRGELTILALRADQTMDNRRVRRVLRSQKLRFARAEEMEALGLTPGQVPPFGEPVLPLALIADQTILTGEKIAFTAGTSTDSLVIDTADWVRVTNPTLAPLTKSEE